MSKSTETDPLLASYSSAVHESIGSWSGSFDGKYVNVKDDDDGGEKEIREKLQWYFKNPYQKYKERNRKPYKLILQIVKIIFVTVQVK